MRAAEEIKKRSRVGPELNNIRVGWLDDMLQMRCDSICDGPPTLSSLIHLDRVDQWNHVKRSAPFRKLGFLCINTSFETLKSGHTLCKKAPRNLHTWVKVLEKKKNQINSNTLGQ